MRRVRLNHPGGSDGFRIDDEDGATLCYLTDNELGPGGSYPVGDGWRRRLTEFLGGVDTLIHDAMYGDQIIEARRGWGHSTPREAVDLASDAGCRRLLLFHHEPEHDDKALDRLLRETRDYALTRGNGLVVDAAAEGMEFPL